MGRIRQALAAWAAGTCALLGVAVAAPAASANESFNGTITSSSVTCNGSNQLSGTFTATGTAAGEWPGTFTENGTFFPVGSTQTALTASFSVGLFTGTKDVLGTASCGQGLDTISSSFSGTGGYAALLPRSPLCPQGGGELGTTTVNYNTFQVVGGPSSGTFSETLTPFARPPGCS